MLVMVRLIGLIRAVMPAGLVTEKRTLHSRNIRIGGLKPFDIRAMKGWKSKDAPHHLTGPKA